MAKGKGQGARRKGGATPRMAPAAAQTISVDAPAAPKKRVSPAQFFSQVRAEGRKITWPSRKETWITSVMVFIMVVLAAVFFWVVDFALGYAFRWIISLGA